MACQCTEIAGDEMPLSETCIGHLWVFKNLAPEELKALTTEASKKRLSKGEALFMQGDRCDEMFLIKGGRVKLSKVLEDGSELTLEGMEVLGQLKITGNPECMVCGFGETCPMSALPWIFGEDTAVTPDKFCKVEDQKEVWEEAKSLGKEIARKLGERMRM